MSSQHVFLPLQGGLCGQFQIRPDALSVDGVIWVCNNYYDNRDDHLQFQNILMLSFREFVLIPNTKHNFQLGNDILFPFYPGLIYYLV